MPTQNTSQDEEEEYNMSKEDMYVKSTQEYDARDNEEMHMGRVYKNKQDMQKELSHFTIKKQFHYKTDNSTKTTTRLSCKDENCHCKLVVNKMGDFGTFKITTYKGAHTCASASEYIDFNYKHEKYKVIW